jgi:hypothetical protein
MPEFPIETWRDIKGYEGFYRISNIGNVKSLNRYRQKNDRILKQSPAGQRGYLHVHLSRENVKKYHYVHILVLENFVGPRPENQEARHFPDNNVTNNKLDNLRWGTRQENQLDRWHNNTMCEGEKQWMAKLKISDVLNIRDLVKYYSQKQVARIYGISRTQVSRIVCHKRWKWLEQQSARAKRVTDMNREAEGAE